MKNKIITVYSLKGGVGKTSIAINLALSMDYCVITNDTYSPVEQVLEEDYYLKLRPEQKLPSRKELQGTDVILDFGGYLDLRLKEALKMSDYVLVPVIESDDLNMQGLISTIAEIAPLTKNIVIILNKMDAQQAKMVRSALKDSGYDYPIFEIKASKVLSSVISRKKSIREIVAEGGLSAYLYEKVAKQFDAIINYLK